jgi:hypothetical protein
MELTMSRHRVHAGLLGGIAGFALMVATTGTALAISPAPPTLKVIPRSVMVTTDATIVGKNFTPGSSVQVTECSATTWVVPNTPCDADNTVTVAANKKGAFKTAFKVELCPGGKHGKNPTSQICYIGVAHPSGIDVVGLLPSARVLVTYP